MDLLPFVETKINHYGNAIISGGDKMDDLALNTFLILTQPRCRRVCSLKQCLS
jgi:hypothetical protein